MQAFQIHERDNVSVALTELAEGINIKISGKEIRLLENIPRGHKIATNKIKQGDDIIKYGYPIGIAIKDINEGEKVDENNIKTKLGKLLSYTYSPQKKDRTEPLHKRQR